MTLLHVGGINGCSCQHLQVMMMQLLQKHCEWQDLLLRALKALKKRKDSHKSRWDEVTRQFHRVGPMVRDRRDKKDSQHKSSKESQKREEELVSVTTEGKNDFVKRKRGINAYRAMKRGSGVEKRPAAPLTHSARPNMSSRRILKHGWPQETLGR